MRYTTLPLVLLLLGVAGHAGAQTPPAKAPPPLTLAQALSKLPPPAKGVWLTVGADKVTLPDGALPPPADASVTTLANTFGDETHDFGSVTAIAPFTRVLLNDNPGPPDFSVNMNGYTAFKMLLASLDDTQWNMLTSEGGLGLSDLTDDTQKLLFHGLFFRGQLWIATQDPALFKLPDDQRTDTRNVSDHIDGVRLRLGQESQIYLHDKKGKTIFFSGPSADRNRLRTWRPKYPPLAAQNNVILRAVVPNTPKPGGLPLSDAKFQPTVSMTGAKTVAELVARIAAKTHTELYADLHYASRTLTIVGPMREAPAADVLAALALAVAGTYRQVGPAYVLTDDLEGVGTRRKRLANWQEKTSQDSSKLANEAGAAMLKRRVSQARSLPAFGNPLAMTPQQMAGLKDNAGIPGVPGRDENFPYARLTPAQQSRVRQIADAYEEQQATKATDSSDDDPPQEPDLTGPVSLQAHYKLQYLIPTVDGPVQTNEDSPVAILFWPGLASAFAIEAKAKAARPAPPVVMPPAPPLLPLLRSYPRRAILGHPTTPAAVDALIAAMQKLGLNELWLDVFSAGKSHLTDKHTDIVTEALQKTQGTGIAVYASLSLLSWGNNPPPETQDLTIVGENSRQAAIADHDRKGEDTENYDDAGQPIPFVPPSVSASPASPQVKKTLTDLVRGLASRPGLAGFVWEDGVRGDDLGYTPEMRLAFLRAFHADPVDITPDDALNYYLSGDTSLPTFDDKAVDATLTKHWDDARLGANGYFLTLLRQAVPNAADKPILMSLGDGAGPFLISWDVPRQLPPPLRPLFAGKDDSSPEQMVSEITKQGRSVLIGLSVKDPASTDALARDLQEALTLPSAPGTAHTKPNAKPPWSGYVLDFDSPGVTDGDRPLSDLVQAVGH